MDATMTAQSTWLINRVRTREGVAEAKRMALALGYEVRWDREGSMYIRDLLMED